MVSELACERVSCRQASGRQRNNLGSFRWHKRCAERFDCMPALDPEEKFIPFTFRPETGPTIRTLALCLVLHYKNALRHTLLLRISARIGSSM